MCFEENSVWLTQQQVAQLLQTSVPSVNMYIGNIYEEEELIPEATIKKFLTVRIEGESEVKRLLRLQPRHDYFRWLPR